MTPLILEATRKADEVRRQFDLDIFQPVNIFDSCTNLGITVRFIDVNMEGMYFTLEDRTNPTIVISSLRPLQRRVFTCAHELGHHIFGHGSRLDELSETETSSNSNAFEEKLVDIFAGALLMPIAGVQAEFANRNIQPDAANAMQFLAISSIFGTGYSTLVVHCKANRIIKETKANMLMKYSPGKLLESLIGPGFIKSNFKLIDEWAHPKLVDIEVNNYLIVPADTIIEGDHLQKQSSSSFGDAYIALKPGIIRAMNLRLRTEYFIRIQNSNYIGLAEYRHLEDK